MMSMSAEPQGSENIIDSGYSSCNKEDETPPQTPMKKSQSGLDLSQSEFQLLSLLGRASIGDSIPPSPKEPPTPGLPNLFRQEVERRLNQGELSKLVARYYLEVLPRGDSRQVPGQNGNPSLLEAVLTENVKNLVKQDAPGSGWRPVRIIGKGAYGCVIMWEKRQRFGPLLRLASKDTVCSSFFKDYCSEAHLTRRLNDLGCPNVIRVVEWKYIDAPLSTVTDGTLSREPSRNRICYEYAEYSDLSRLEKWYRKHKLIFPEAFIWHVLYSMANALCYCRHGSSSQPWRPGWDSIVHGDLKEANIFMATPDRDVNTMYPCIKLADFGLAYTLSGSTMAVQHFRSLGVYGTDGYIAPEVDDQTPEKTGRRRLPNELHGPHSDIYSLGMTCKHMLSLLSLHVQKEERSADRYASTLFKHVEVLPAADDVPITTTTGIGIGDLPARGIYSDVLISVLERCTATDPRQRPKTSRLLQECRAQMEVYREKAYVAASLARRECESRFYDGQVLYTAESQHKYETDQMFRDNYRRATLSSLWNLLEQQQQMDRKHSDGKEGFLSSVQSFAFEKTKATGLERLVRSVLKK